MKVRAGASQDHLAAALHYLQENSRRLLAAVLGLLRRRRGRANVASSLLNAAIRTNDPMTHRAIDAGMPTPLKL